MHCIWCATFDRMRWNLHVEQGLSFVISRFLGKLRHYTFADRSCLGIVMAPGDGSNRAPSKPWGLLNALIMPSAMPMLDGQMLHHFSNR